ncbi:hypothetical protein Tco_0159589, partial [Tanacetum coccineum]
YETMGAEVDIGGIAFLTLLNVTSSMAWGKSLVEDVKSKNLGVESLQHLPLSPGTNPGFPGRVVAGDSFLGRHVARDKWNGKARMGYLPERHSRATTPGSHSFSQTIKCHGGSFSRATCRPGY